MGKNDFLTPKAIANRIKSKGLQKLRWYCQMCQKQCRDENGFKCHLTSESHKRQMIVFGVNPMRVVEGYTEEFEKTFMEHLRRSHPHSRVQAKMVYNEYIADRHHVHMNSTSWLTLTEFVKHLGKTGQCRVDETEKGWYISVIQPDPSQALADDKKSKRERAEKEEDERQREILEAQIARARAQAGLEEKGGAAEGTELRRDEDGQPLQIALAAPPKPAAHEAAMPGAGGGGAAAPKKRSKLEELMEREQAFKKAKIEREKAGAGAGPSGRPDAPWLQPGITVKVLSKELKEHGYYKKKGIVEKLPSKYVGQIKMLDSGDVLQVDQAQLETVLPAAGGSVVVVRGAQRGARAEMLEIDVDKYRAQVQLKSGDGKGEKVWFDYEDICKVSSS
ncbi:hypothetical protein COCSUDRAFT_11364 [Coccomyxa subellipsoidea C-169]|uniref:DNA/RNA-binding protein Kin17 WH-like domain-containing protein n=1 Tax=Coccomyxa subellipsoidea (strain C-169) TaxID=574566 RepID=I0ZAJ5_COCSC|nr:hypothetical protein COCSUDRAFT_11364 [Coccomyxa subellipsoidea C-169]EIE27664.1 hypothetical protein COCSUDRAFT_11364 [Coccomyxa subellipsoidea C-169]|eukprot:XP_005652208.1 hypothetical protein COCSUDRAFT_11364 [Coccomyxa subellipsoidea C-169]